MPITSLRLPDPFEEEEDIAEASPYLSGAGTSTPASLTYSTPSSSAASLTTPTPARLVFSDAFDAPRISHALISRKKSLEYVKAPPYPVTSMPSTPPMRPASLTRSQTLPRVHQLQNLQRPRKRQADLDQLAVPQATIDKMRRWIIGVVIVDFDVDDGPVVDGVFPPQSTLFPPEAESLAFSSFPDSLQFDQGSQCHSFRIREQKDSPKAEKRSWSSKDGFIYGFSHFTQKRDSTSKRGYEQRSVVILTQHQYPAFFSLLVSIFGPLFQQHGLPTLEVLCQNIASWQDPTPGETFEVAFLGSVVKLALPRTFDEQQFVPSPGALEKWYDPLKFTAALSSPLSPPPLLLFEAAVSQVWSIWECLVLCEPLLVFGASPAQTSQAVWWLRDLLRPVPLAGDFRPYFTMQDGDQSMLVNNRLPPKPGVVLGVTNPFFEKSCHHWPHILSLGRRRTNRASAIPNSAALNSASPIPPGPTPGWKSKTHKRYISKDRVLLGQLEAALRRGDDKAKLVASLALRQHFHSRTTEVITPLARYLNTLIPSPTEVASAKSLTHAKGDDKSHSSALRLKPFNTASFFASLKTHGSTLPFRSTKKRTDFYERLLRSPWFGLWLAQQEGIVEGVLKERKGP